jgi:SAM-dependent methyltransferase
VKLAVEVAKNVAAATRSGRWARKLWHRGGLNPATNAPDYARKVFAYQRAAIEAHRPIAGRLLEVGPGRNLGVASLFVQAGCHSAVAIDRERWLDPPDNYYEELGTARELERVEYRCPLPIEAAGYPDGYFDLVVSHVVAEYFADPDAAVRNIVRMLAPGGVSLHRMRLLGHWDAERPFRFLRYSDRTWRWATSHQPGQPNRWRLSDWIAAFSRHGAPAVAVEVTKRTEITDNERTRLTRAFRAKSLDDLSVYGAWVLTIKPT